MPAAATSRGARRPLRAIVRLLRRALQRAARKRRSAYSAERRKSTHNSGGTSNEEPQSGDEEAAHNKQHSPSKQQATQQQHKGKSKEQQQQPQAKKRRAIATWPLDKQTVSDGASFGDSEDLASEHLRGRVTRLSRCAQLPLFSTRLSDWRRHSTAAYANGARLSGGRRPFACPTESPSTNWIRNATQRAAAAACQADDDDDDGAAAVALLRCSHARRRRSYDEQEGDADESIIAGAGLELFFSPASSSLSSSSSSFVVASAKTSPTRRTTRPQIDTSACLAAPKLSVARALLDLDYNKTVQLFIGKSSLNWNFNSFTFDALCCGKSLTELLLHLFDYYDLHAQFKLNIVNVLKCFRLLELGYHSSNPYHNSIHAADVTQAMHCFIQEAKIRAHMTQLETLASILAAVCHDLDHPGVSQAFLASTQNPLVGLYKNCSVLENHHWRFALAIFKESAVFEHLARETLVELKRQLKTLILATDIAHQNEYLTRFKALTSSANFSMADAEHRSLVLQMALKCADLGNPCRPWILSKCWSEQICTEFYRQGDYERRLALAPLTPMCQRRSASVASIQTDFFRIIVLPLVELWHQFLRSPLSRLLMTNLNANYERWQKANRIAQQMRRRKSFASLEPLADDECNHYDYYYNDAHYDYCDSKRDYSGGGGDGDGVVASAHSTRRCANADTLDNIPPAKRKPRRCATSNSTTQHRHAPFNSSSAAAAANVRRQNAFSDLVKSDNERLHQLRSLHLQRMMKRMPKFVA